MPEKETLQVEAAAAKLKNTCKRRLEAIDVLSDTTPTHAAGVPTEQLFTQPFFFCLTQNLSVSSFSGAADNMKTNMRDKPLIDIKLQRNCIDSERGAFALFFPKFTIWKDHRNSLFW